MKGFPLKILVPVKRVVDLNIRVSVHNNAVNTQNLKHSMNPFDMIAVEEALKLKEKVPKCEVTAITVGTQKCLEVLQTALGMGADRAVHVMTHEENLSPLTVSSVLARVMKQHQYDLAILGKQAIDNDYGQTGSMLSALLELPLASFARKVSLNNGDAHNSSLTVTTETDTGLRIVKLLLPAIIITELGLNTPRYVSLSNMAKAKRKPTEKMLLSDLGLDITPPLNIQNVFAPPARAPCILAKNVDDLIVKLKAKISTDFLK